MNAVQQYCDRAMLLERGRSSRRATRSDVGRQYLR